MGRLDFVNPKFLNISAAEGVGRASASMPCLELVDQVGHVPSQASRRGLASATLFGRCRRGRCEQQGPQGAGGGRTRPM